LTFRRTADCDNDSSAEYKVPGFNSDWNGHIDSAEGFGRCHGVYWEHANFGGASVGTPWTDGSPMEDEASSVYFV
jgi:hypothetical protein